MNSELRQIPGNWEHESLWVRRPGEALQLHYLAAGRKDAPRVILLHGFPDFSYTWRDVIPLLAKDYRVLAPDLPGYAMSAKPKAGYEISMLAADIADFVAVSAAKDRAPPGTPTHLVGHDWGAAVGWWVVMVHPDRFTSFTAIDVPHPVAFADFLRSSAEQRKKSAYLRKLASPLAPGVFARMNDKKRTDLYRDGLTRKEAFGDAQLTWYRAAFDTKTETRGPLSYYKAKFANAQADEHAARKAAKVAIPVLVMWGDQDEYLMKEMAAESCEHVGGDCQVQIFSGASHWPHWDDPNAVVARWRIFVAPESAASADPE